eukprot:gnl/MRDRNA2_/MRDRNA2_50715_c0_seq1.p1 gnl/MRDRNA2_/MRDRNA2_50715_c0~~gnl/MRDRNA2_/MRDRNA2_50715_c0_seq1.p1  ORF type:complete len:345 (-),score=70.09 gnl/MRDRNA2_/MRDRNA2_50715_c0_seq1:29-988(-)
MADASETMKPLDLMDKRNQNMHEEESIRCGRTFKPRSTDVFVVTYPKCGTTWMTQICHQLRTRGDMDFDEITVVCPWDIQAVLCGQDLDADHVANPRVWKSHERAGDVAQGAKYIHVCRHPDDAFISFYRFLPGWMGIADGEITAKEFAEAVFGGVSHSGGIWDYYVGWWERRNDPNVLWVCFEDMKEDLRREITRVAKFMDIPLTEELLAIVEKNSSIGFMGERSGQFDDHWMFDKIRDRMGFPKDYVFGEHSRSKVRVGGGKVGDSKNLPDEVKEMLRKRWENTVQAKIGFKDYDEMRQAIAKLHEEGSSTTNCEIL